VTQIECFSFDVCSSNTVHSQTIDLTADSEEDNAPTGSLSRSNTTSRGKSRLGFSAEAPINLDPDDIQPPKVTTSGNSQAQMPSLRSLPAEEEAHGSEAGAAESRTTNVQDVAPPSSSRLPDHTKSSTNPAGVSSQSALQASPEKFSTSSRKRKRFFTQSSDDNHLEDVHDETMLDPPITSSIEPQEPLSSQSFRQLKIQNFERKYGSEDTSGTSDSVFGSTPILDASDSDTISYKHVTDTLEAHIEDLRTTHAYFTKVSLVQILSEEISTDFVRYT